MDEKMSKLMAAFVLIFAQLSSRNLASASGSTSASASHQLKQWNNETFLSEDCLGDFAKEGVSVLKLFFFAS